MLEFMLKKFESSYSLLDYSFHLILFCFIFFFSRFWYLVGLKYGVVKLNPFVFSEKR